jgi:AcrR family transcriptional regulator
VSQTSGDDIAAAAGLSTRTVWRYFRSKESCVEPVLALSAQRFIALADRWPAELSLADHMAAYTAAHPLTEQEVADEMSALRIATLSATEPALRTAYLMVHDEMERGFLPVVARRLRLPEDDLTVRLCAAAVTGAFRVIDEDVGHRLIVEKEKVSQQEALALIDRAIRGPVPP